MADHNLLQRWIRNYPSDAYHSTHAEDSTRARIASVKQRERAGCLDDDDLDFVRLLKETYAFGFTDSAKRSTRTKREPVVAPNDTEVALIVDMEGYRREEDTRALMKRDDAAPLLVSGAASSARGPTASEREKGCENVRKDVPKAVRRYLTHTPQPCTPGYDEKMAREALVQRAQVAFTEDVCTRFDTWEDEGKPATVIVVEAFPPWVDLAAKRASVFDCCQQISWVLRPIERTRGYAADGARAAKRTRR